MNGFIITEKDIKEAERYYSNDRIKSISLKNLFKAAIYSLLSIGQLYKIQMNVFRLLVQNGFDNPEYILNNYDLFKSIIYKTRFSKSIEKYFLYLCNNWKDIKNLFFNIIIDCNNGRNKEYYFREKLIKNIKGFGYKVASLFLDIVGYDNIAVIDVWMLRFLREQGFEISYNEEKEGGLSKNKYLLYEQYLKIIADKYNFSVGLFQCIVWCKYSSWNKKYNKDQLYFDFWNKI